MTSFRQIDANRRNARKSTGTLLQTSSWSSVAFLNSTPAFSGALRMADAFGKCHRRLLAIAAVLDDS